MATAIILDLIIVGVLAIFLILGVVKGLVNMLAGLAALVAGIFGGSYIARVFTKPVADALVLPWVNKTLGLAAQGQQLPEGAVVGEGGTLSESAAGSIAGIMETSKLPRISFEGVTDSIGRHIEETGAELLDAASEVIAERLTYVILFIAAFVLIQVIVLLLFKLLNIVSKAPVLNAFNKISGGVVGIVSGALLVLFLIWAASTFVRPATADGALLSKGVVEKTYIARYFYIMKNVVLY